MGPTRREAAVLAMGLTALLLLTPVVIAAGHGSAAAATQSPAATPVLVAPELRHAVDAPTLGSQPAGSLAKSGRPPGIPAYRLGTVSRASTACPADTGINPAWLAFDSTNHTFWVADPPSCVDVFSLSSAGSPQNQTASIPVGSDPFGVAVDNVTNDVFVTNSGSNNVSVLSGANDTVIASVDVGINPHGAAFDWASNSIYVANTGSNDVTVISGSTLSVVATVAVGASPIGVAADLTSRQVFVANFGSANVTAISDATNETAASITTGNGSYGVAWDNASNEIFVSNEEAENVSVIDAATDVAIAAVPVVDSIQLQGIAYDPATASVWVGGGAAFAVVIDARTDALVGYVGTDPSGVAYDPANGDVCVTNTANVTFECFEFGFARAADPLTFHETGLPTGDSWTVVLNASGPNSTSQRSTAANITFGTAGWYWIQYEYRIPEPRGFVATPASGVEVLDGSPIVVSVSITRTPSLYPVDFNETGLPSGTNWSVTLRTTTESTSADTVGFLEPNGTYPFVVNSPAGFAASPGSGSIVVNGTGVPQAIVFSAGAVPLSANFSYQIEYASCLTDDGVTNFVVLDALAGGGSPPYSYNWTLPTGAATTALASTTTTYGQGNTVTLTVVDSSGKTATHSIQLPMELPPCPPPALTSTAPTPLSVDQWAIVGLAVALVAVSGVAVWLGRRGKGGSPGTR